MRIPIFLSYPQPHLTEQKSFMAQLTTYFRARGLEPRTLGVTDYDMDAPLTAIRRLMLESNGLITIALRRTYVRDATQRSGANLPGMKDSPVSDVWLTSPYCQIEPAMAYQLGLPILLLRERGVVAEGLLQHGVVGLFMPEVDLSTSPKSYFSSHEWKDIIGKWEGQVRAVVASKANPPRLY